MLREARMNTDIQTSQFSGSETVFVDLVVALVVVTHGIHHSTCFKCVLQEGHVGADRLVVDPRQLECKPCYVPEADSQLYLARKQQRHSDSETKLLNLEFSNKTIARVLRAVFGKLEACVWCVWTSDLMSKCLLSLVRVFS